MQWKSILLLRLPVLIQPFVELAISDFKFPGQYCAKKKIKNLCLKEANP